VHYLKTFLRFAPFCPTWDWGKEKKGQASLCAWLLIYKDFIAFIIIKLFVFSQTQTLSVSAQNKFAASRKDCKRVGVANIYFFCLPFFFYQKFDQKASNIRVVFSLCTLQVAHDYQHTEATRDNFCQAAGERGGSTCDLFVSVGVSSRGPGTFASANRELYKAAGHSKKYIYIYRFYFIS
jgi:hypothetical protein